MKVYTQVNNLKKKNTNTQETGIVPNKSHICHGLINNNTSLELKDIKTGLKLVDNFKFGFLDLWAISLI